MLCFHKDIYTKSAIKTAISDCSGIDHIKVVSRGKYFCIVQANSGKGSSLLFIDEFAQAVLLNRIMER